MEKLVDNIIQCELDEIKFQKFPYGERFGLIVPINNVKYEFILNLTKSKHVIILGSGARDAQQSIEYKSRPFFNRWSWNFEESTINYNDPTTYLSEELLCGWGLGTKDDYYLENIAKIIVAICDTLGFKSEDMIFYGSSAGGFTSLILSTIIKNSVAIADIPQIDLTNYMPAYWNKIKKYCFNNLEESDIKKKYYHRLSFIEQIKREKYIPNAYLILDCSCVNDFNNHYLPLFKSLDQLPYKNKNHLRIRIDGKNLGHRVLDKDSSVKTINNILNLNYNKINDYASKLEENNNKIKILNSEINKLKEENVKLKEENKKLLKFREDVLNSNTWKYSEFLRKLKRGK